MGVAEHWINLRFVLFKNKILDNSSDNADMSSEKDNLALSLWYLIKTASKQKTKDSFI